MFPGSLTFECWQATDDGFSVAKKVVAQSEQEAAEKWLAMAGLNEAEVLVRAYYSAHKATRWVVRLVTVQVPKAAQLP